MNVATAEVISNIGTIPILSFFGRTPKFTLLCGNCGTSFKKGFTITECENRNPFTTCPSCQSINKVNIYWDEEEGEIRLDYDEDDCEEW